MKNLLWILPVIFVAVILRIVELDKKKSHFVVTGDTNVSQVKGLSKYVSQEEVDSFAFRHWNIDKDKVMNNDKMENLRLLLKSKNTQEILNYVKDNNISVDEPLHYGVTPLMYASFYDDINTAKELINLGADPHKKDRYKLSPMAYAIGANSINTVKLLLANGVKFEEVEVVQGYIIPKWYEATNTTKIYVDENSSVINVKISDKSDADYIFEKGVWGTAFDVVVKSNMLEMTKLMLDSGYKPPKYHFADFFDPDIRSGNTVEEIFTQDELNVMIDTEKKSSKFVGERKKFDLDIFYDEVKFYSLSPYREFHNLYGYEPMLNLLLDYNISGQPSQKVMREVYEDCYDDYKRAIKEKVYYLAEMRQGVDKYAEELTTYQYAKKHNMKRKADRSGLDILGQLLKDKVIVRTPKEPTPFIVNLLDKNIERHAKYCGDKDLDFERDLVNWNDEIFGMAQQYHALFKWEDKPIPETANFKDTREFMMYLNDRERNKLLPSAIVKDTNMTYEKYIQKEVDKQAQTLTEKIKFGNKSKQELIELKHWFYN